MTRTTKKRHGLETQRPWLKASEKTRRLSFVVSSFFFSGSLPIESTGKTLPQAAPKGARKGLLD